MSEHEPHMTPEGRPAPERASPDWRRLVVARDRSLTPIADGIAQAIAEREEIDEGTARCIAHALGRAYGPGSALATFGRTGEGNYLSLRDEYLDLYGDERADAVTKEMIDWLGTYLVQRENTGSGRRFMNEHLPPKLDQLLVRTSVRVGDGRFIVNVPASWHSGHEDELVELLTTLQLDQDEALQAFLALPDVSVGTDDIMESFHEAFAGTYQTEEAALRALSPLEDWETSLADWCIDHGLELEALEWNCEPLMARLRDVYDVVEGKGVLHVFNK
ncbi:hypothetical protein [Microbacterium sp.]|uniref:hypothetical protein n=1 Tax=unclassified Microbacterium TaxID=2609290 RepID=UPI000C35C0E0|nr:hypothetical protein [Microbacterium sp.]MAY50701.1 hypothetical protein [Microbacterium sp.]HAS31166.1 hypothetical protein [Microbacterium sp.]HBR89662.1 hypothetical protein [Microbacterium sp.]HBS75936.1 hypothetical protein [Microbacterium sp.]|tara:strand:- start:2821 stop:3645 length:825 start_codon:yes stop_codon:yes gene_type:complete